jgi:hypothetical protein
VSLIVSPCFSCAARKQAHAPLQCAGEEGYRSTGAVLKGEYGWLDNGLKGEDLPLNSRCQHVDYVTVHIYPDNWGVPFSDFRWVTDTYMKVRMRVQMGVHMGAAVQLVMCSGRALWLRCLLLLPLPLPLLLLPLLLLRCRC